MKEEIEIVKSEAKDLITIADPNEFLRNAADKLIRLGTGALTLERKEGIQLSGRLLRAGVNGHLLKQFSEELTRLRDKGMIDDERLQSVRIVGSLADFLRMLEEETMSEEKFNAIKTAFFATVSINTDEKQSAYYTLISNKINHLDGLQILVLSACYNIYKKEERFDNSHVSAWLTTISMALGHGSTELVALAEEGLVDLKILSARTGSDKSGISIENARLTGLGLEMCKILEENTYEELMKGSKT